MKFNPPDIYLEPEISNVRVLEFHKSQQIYAQTATECDRLRTELSALLEV
jgi:predicted acylesterase/phospholipase RssA